jgi:transketolase
MLDLAIMRATPNMTVFVPGDATETAAIMAYLAEHPGPAYMRAPRGRTPLILDPDTYSFEAGKAVQLRDGSDVTIVACGIELPRALAAADQLLQAGISAQVINMSSIKPLDEEALLNAASETGCIVTAENHNVFGGMGSAVAELVSSYDPVPVIRVGIRDTFGGVGPTEWLAEQYGISASHIVQAAREALDRKGRRR